MGRYSFPVSNFHRLSFASFAGALRIRRGPQAMGNESSAFMLEKITGLCTQSRVFMRSAKAEDRCH